ncbi:hypothetical protein M0R45_004324 [Rubus argutus]|uniref:TF-B3 domain-containing protein n=1 Tax=Rubus argutus TaxID=59490 RepID=A0AAW1YJF0_RUBAR
MATTRKPSFFKLLLGDHFSSKLKIPGAFLRNFDGKVPEQCHLGVQARTWLVYVEKVDHKFYFQDGWQKFVHENGLKGGEILVFFYAGNSEFSVDIYGKNACKKMLGKAPREESDCLRSNYVGSSTEIDYSMKIPKMGEADDSSVEILDDFPPCPRRTGEKSSLTSHRPHKKNSTSSSGKNDFLVEKHVGGTSSKQRLVQQNPEILGRMHTDVDDDDKEDDEGEEDDDDCEEKEDDDDNETEADSESEDEDDDDNETEADSEDEDEDDEEEEENDEDEDNSDDSIEILDEFPPCPKGKTLGKSSLASGLPKRQIKSSKTKAQSNRRHAGGLSGTRKIKERKPRGPRKMPGIGELMALEKASNFKSKTVNPSFSIAMSPSYVKGSYVHLPHDFSNTHLNKQCLTISLRINESTWCAAIYKIRRTTRLQAGWSEFAHGNNLKKGDVCVFVLTDSSQFVFDVKVFRATEAAK